MVQWQYVPKTFSERPVVIPTHIIQGSFPTRSRSVRECVLPSRKSTTITAYVSLSAVLTFHSVNTNMSRNDVL